MDLPAAAMLKMKIIVAQSEKCCKLIDVSFDKIQLELDSTKRF